MAINSPVTTHCQIYDQTKFHIVKGKDNSFDHNYGIVFCPINKRIISVKIGLFLQAITFKKEFPDSNFLLTTLLTGGKWNFQVANLLLFIVNYEP